ncbi:myb-like protein D isoform X2 [Leptopilina boulardi]|uniref:myb-like protein D isoform X2 n=1 Tax=Leptopilina boulardi TaxID=63433 RepID=UPI0021F59460|nr:myb-like protein D isoform X2 [Leptopilina boulardi]
MSENNNPRENMKHDEVVLEKTGHHVKIFGPYTKKDLRRLLLSSMSLYPDTDNEQEALEFIGISEQELRNIKNGENISENTHKKLQYLDITEDMIKDVGKKINKKSDTFSKQNNNNNNIIINEEEFQNKNYNFENNQKTEKSYENNNFINCELPIEKNFSKDMKNHLLRNDIIEDKVSSLENLKFSTEGKKSLQNFAQVNINSSKENNFMSINNLYLKSNIFEPIKKAICEIILRKPNDPVEFLGQWLLHYKICVEREKERNECDAELSTERENSKIKQQISGKKVYSLNDNKNKNDSENESENSSDFLEENIIYN